jgi:hypothetical protein
MSDLPGGSSCSGGVTGRRRPLLASGGRPVGNLCPCDPTVRLLTNSLPVEKTSLLPIECTSSVLPVLEIVSSFGSDLPRTKLTAGAIVLLSNEG